MANNNFDEMSNKDLKEAMKLGLMNFDSLKDFAKPTMKLRLQHMELAMERRGVVTGKKAKALCSIIDALNANVIDCKYTQGCRDVAAIAVDFHGNEYIACETHANVMVEKGGTVTRRLSK